MTELVQRPHFPGEKWVNLHVHDGFQQGITILPGAAATRRLATFVYELPSSPVCVGDCPVEASGAHAVELMRPLRVGGRSGAESDRPVVDGLAPYEIVDIKAHAAARNGVNGLLTFQHRSGRPGQPDSFGALLVRIPLPGGEYFEYIVSTSGADKRADHHISRVVSARLEFGLFADGIVPMADPVGDTFIIGVTREQVAEFVRA